MNTTKKGDILEDKSIGIIEKILDDGLIGVMKQYARVYTKKKYPSNLRDSGDVEFDLTIEIWPPNADRYSMIYFIECKNYKSRVSIDKVKKFYADIQETSGVNAKAIFITNTPLQSGAYEYAMAKRMMVIEGESKDNFKITLYKRNIEEENIVPILEPTLNTKLLDEGIKLMSKEIDKLILSCLIPSKSNIAYRIDLLSKSDIDKIACKELDYFNPSYLVNAYGLSVSDITNYLKNEYDMKIIHFDPSKNQYLGTCDIDKRIIGISKGIVNTERESFVLCHEFGHFVLHQKLSINQELLNSFSDSSYDFATGKNSLENPRQWIEWQANFFSISFLIPRSSLMAKLWQAQQRRGLPQGNLYLDDQKVNQNSFGQIISYLSNHFNVSKTSIIYRLREFDLITDNSRTKAIGQIISEYKSKYFV